LIVWASGDAYLMIGNFAKKEVLLEEHRQITGEIGFDDAEATVRAWLA
jgi:hypothetical protein